MMTPAPFLLLSSALLALSIAAPAHAEAAAPAEAARALSLQACLRAVLEHNPELAAQRLGAEIGALDWAQAGHRYGLSLRAGPSLERAIRPTSQSFLSGGVSRLEEWSQNYSMALQQGLPTGGDLSLRLSNAVFDTNSNRVDFNPSFTPGVNLSFSQPLLRNWWSGMREIEIARLDAEDTRSGVEDRLLRLVADTEVAYWELVAAREQIRVRERSLGLVRDLLAINRQKAKAGLLAQLDVVQAEASLAMRESSLLEAQRTLASAEDRLRRLIDPNFEAEQWRQPITPTDKPDFQGVEAPFEASWALAQARRPDLRQATLQTARQQAVLDQAGNRLWPKLDLTGAAGVTNLGAQLDKAVSELPNSQNFNLQGGLAFEWPLGPNADRDEYDKARLRLDQARLRQRAAEQQAFVDVREACRDVTILGKRVEASGLARKLADIKLDAEQQKLKAGLSTNFQVLEYQKDLEEAALAEVQATITYLQALTRWERARGTLLESRGLTSSAPRTPEVRWK